MAFPSINEPQVLCQGFPKKYFPALKRAIQDKKVKWGKNSLFVDICIAQFEWAGCVWELEEMRETVCSITLISGEPNEEDLTAAVLRG